MELSIDKAGEVIGYCQAKVNELENDPNLSEQGKLNQFKELSSNIEKQLDAWDIEVDNAQKVLKEELESKKPVFLKRDLTKENLDSLKYLSKTLLSKVVAEGNSWGELRAILEDVLQEGDPMTLQAFIDNYTDFSHSLASKDYDPSNTLLEYYHSFKKKLKTPEQLAYEEAEKEWFAKSNSLSTRYHAIKTTLKEIKTKPDTRTWGGKF